MATLHHISCADIWLGTCKYQADYEKDFEAINADSGSTIVRGYAASDCNAAQQILPAAKAKGFQVVLGVWPDTDESFAADVSSIKNFFTFPPLTIAFLVEKSPHNLRSPVQGPSLCGDSRLRIPVPW